MLQQRRLRQSDLTFVDIAEVQNANVVYATADKTMWVSTSAICTVLVLDVFGWTTFTAMEQSQTLVLVDIEDGEVILAATVMMSRYHAFRMRLYHVGFCYFCTPIA